MHFIYVRLQNLDFSKASAGILLHCKSTWSNGLNNKSCRFRPIQQETDVHITSDVFRIPQMLPVSACSHAGKRSNKEVTLRFMIMPVLQTSGVVQHVLNIMLKFSRRKYCEAFCVIKIFDFPCPQNVWGGVEEIQVD